MGLQNWPAYNTAQTSEKLWFLDLLADLTQQIDWQSTPRRRGRPSADLREMVFACVTKVYEGLSSRRATSDLELAKRHGYLTATPHFNTISKYMNEPGLMPLLTGLIELSSLPLRGFEDTFAVDASGLSSAFYSRWFDYRYGEAREQHSWLKIHLICGVKTHVVTAITVTDGHTNDSPQFPYLLNRTARHFAVATVCADKGYSSRANHQAAADLGATPFISFKGNTIARSNGCEAWNKMFHYFKLHETEFLAKYHQRSNVESVFSALKRKFQNHLYSKNEVSQVNEALAKVLCHNLCVLAYEAQLNGLEIDFDACTQIPPLAHKMPQQTLV